MGINKVILIGRLGQDPELRYTPNHVPVCNLNIATGERRKTADGNWEEHTEWHRVVCFGRTAENCSQFLSKGRQVYVEGRLQTQKWQDKDGNTRYTTEIIASTIQFLGGRGDVGTAKEIAPPEVNQIEEAAGSMPLPDNENSGEAVSLDDDEIPF